MSTATPNDVINPRAGGWSSGPPPLELEDEVHGEDGKALEDEAPEEEGARRRKGCASARWKGGIGARWR